MSRHKLFAALAAAGCLAATAPSGAVEVNPDGIGQVLLYSYYTVRSSSAGNALNTLLTVGNTTDHVKAVRLRFREGAVGVSVVEVNLYLGARDMWTGAVVPRDDGGAELVTFDFSCTVPLMHGATQVRLAFSNSGYVGDPLDGSIDRTREGFFEMIEMGDYGLASAAAPGSVAAGASPIGGVPFDCGAVQADTGVEAQPGTGGLFGRAILINVGDGTEFSYSATALANFNTTRSLWAAADAPGATLADVDPPVSVVQSSSVGTIRTQWTQPIDAVSAVLMHASLNNEFVLDDSTRSITDWVVTMPTKYFYVSLGVSPTRLFLSPLRLNGACELVQSRYRATVLFDRESRSFGPGVGPPGQPFGAFCWATTVVGFMGQNGAETLFGTKNAYAEADGSLGPSSAVPASVRTSFEDGWMIIPFDSALPGLEHLLVGGATILYKRDGSVEARPQATYHGLPVIGFAAESYTNGTLTVNGQRVLSNYGGLIGHRYTNDVR
ncbi:MAG TPA: hypothetical protein VGR42_03850 [Casimicrobiaceae bacterium]|nr:hypothetical protein [Casimicrobiaceae bacterium]